MLLLYEQVVDEPGSYILVRHYGIYLDRLASALSGRYCSPKSMKLINYYNYSENKLL